VVQATVALRVDVDTRRGLEEGVPRLLALLRRLDLRASFFVTMGPDRSGRAIRRALRPSFLLKMWRTNPLRLYGLRTLLSGTLLPARLVGAGAPALPLPGSLLGDELGEAFAAGMLAVGSCGAERRSTLLTCDASCGSWKSVPVETGVKPAGRPAGPYVSDGPAGWAAACRRGPAMLPAAPEVAAGTPPAASWMTP